MFLVDKDPDVTRDRRTALFQGFDQAVEADSRLCLTGRFGSREESAQEDSQYGPKSMSRDDMVKRQEGFHLSPRGTHLEVVTPGRLVIYCNDPKLLGRDYSTGARI